jgi:hypothetical protein
MTGPAVTMSPQMNESDSSVGGVSSADPLLSEPGLAESETNGSAAEPDVEIVDGLPVLAEVRTVERAAPAALPAVQVAAVAATGFVAGAATVALVKRRSARKVARNSRAGSRRAVDLLPIAASRSFLVDVHVLAKPE